MRRVSSSALPLTPGTAFARPITTDRSVDVQDLVDAIAHVRHGNTIASQHRRRAASLPTRLAGLVVGSLNTSGSGLIKSMTAMERHAELIYAETLFEKVRKLPFAAEIERAFLRGRPCILSLLCSSVRHLWFRIVSGVRLLWYRTHAAALRCHIRLSVASRSRNITFREVGATSDGVEPRSRS